VRSLKGNIGGIQYCGSVCVGGGRRSNLSEQFPNFPVSTTPGMHFKALKAYYIS
jgi:hypothetical protein